MFENLKVKAAQWLFKSAETTSLPFVSYVQQRIGSYLFGNTNEAKYLEAYRGWVYACVTARATAVKGINWRLFKNKK